MMKKYALVILTVLGYWIMGFYPFQWSLPFRTDDTYENAAQPRVDGGWEFYEPGIVNTLNAPDWLPEVIERSALHIVLEVRSTYREQFGPARIFTLSQDSSHRNITIAQEGADLILRLRTPQTDLNGIPSYRIADVFADLAWRQIDVVISTREVRVQINEVLGLVAELPAWALRSWKVNYQLALGNELTFDRPWLGEIRKAEIRIGGRTVDYACPNRLAVPKLYSVPRSGPQVELVPFSGQARDWSRLLDWLLNLVGFIPFGLIVARGVQHHRVILSALLASFALSLSIEVGQLFLSARFTQSEDVLLNVIGGTLGAAFTHRSCVSRHVSTEHSSG